MKIFSSVLMIALGFVVTFLSDLYIRTADIPGTDPDSYDLVGSLLLGAGFIAFFIALYKED